MRKSTIGILLAVVVLGALFALLQRVGNEPAQAEAELVQKRARTEARGPWAVIPQSAGVNAETTELTGEDLERMAAIGLKYVRFGVRWWELEASKGQYNWEPYDYIQTHMKRLGLKPIYLLAYSNGLYDTDHLPFNEVAEREGFRAFAVAAVKRYDAPGVIWEIGNEQDTFHFWRTATPGNTPDNARARARDFMATAKLAVPAMRKASPKAFIISGGVLDIGWRVSQAWLDQAFELGALELFDGVGVHMYGRPALEPEGRLLGALSRLRGRIAAHGGKPDHPIFQTEYGIGLHNEDTTGPHAHRLLQHARINVRVYLISLMSGLKVNVWYEWRRKSPQWAKDERGLVDPEGKERPMYVAARVMLRELDGFVFDSRHPLGDEDDYALLFTKGEERKLVVWTTDKPHDLVIKADGKPPQYAVATMLGTQDSKPSKAGALTVRITDTPTYVGWGRPGAVGAKDKPRPSPSVH